MQSLHFYHPEKKALATFLNFVGPAAMRFIRESYGDVQDYLTTRIEAEVREQKSKTTTALSLVGEPFTAELNEAPDVTAVAASTAAATAAAVVQKAIPPDACHQHPCQPTGGRDGPGNIRIVPGQNFAPWARNGRQCRRSDLLYRIPENRARAAPMSDFRHRGFLHALGG